MTGTAGRHTMRSHEKGARPARGLRPRRCIALALALAACAGAPDPLPEPGAGVGLALDPGAVRPIVLAIEPVPLRPAARLDRVARMLAPLGAPGAKSRCADAVWSEMQPSPGAAIDFQRLDAFVAAFSEAGFPSLAICLATTGRASPPAAGAHPGEPSPAPGPEDLDAFARFVAAVVERYDADGVGDMPDLRNPVRLYQIGSFFSGGAPDFADAYVNALERAHRAAHAADSEVVVAHAAFPSSGALLESANPGEASALDAREARVSERSRADLRRVLDRSDAFDALAVNGLGDAVEIEAALEWLHHETEARGVFKPVIVTEVAPTPLVAWGPATRCAGPPYEIGLVSYPAREEDRCRLAEWFQKLVAGQDEALAWARARAALDLVKKLIVAADRGVWWLSVAPIEDAAWWTQPPFEAAAGLSPWGGLIDARRSEYRPVFYALRQLLQALGGRDQIRRIFVGPSDVRLYLFDGPAGPGWIGWYDPVRVHLPGDATLKRVVSLETGAVRVHLEPIITRPEQTEPAARVIGTQDGAVRLELTSTPLLVLPLR